MGQETVAIASDHGGYELKEVLKGELAAKDYKLLDLGANSADSVDYPDVDKALAEAVEGGRHTRRVKKLG